MKLTELIEEAELYNLVDSWGRIGDTIFLRTATVTLDLDEEKAKPFVCGLLRGYEVAQGLGGDDIPRINERAQLSPAGNWALLPQGISTPKEPRGAL